MTQKVTKILKEVEIRLIEWLDKKPSGSFNITVYANEGGIRGKPKVATEETLDIR